MKKFLLLSMVMLGFAWQSNAQISWSYDESTTTLTISGSGEMDDYEAKTPRPDWLKDADAKNATSLIIEEGVTSVGEYAFYNMKITEVVIPASITEIGASAFANCRNLVNIKWQGIDAITINATAFNNIATKSVLNYLSGADIAAWEDYTYIRTYKVYGEGTINNTTITYTLYDGVLTIKGTGTIPARAFGSKDLNDVDAIVIGEGIEAIGASAFNGNSDVQSIELPSTLKTLESNAFVNFNSVEELFIPAALTEIKSGAFNGFSSLAKIVVEDGNAAYDSRNNCNAIISKADNALILGSTATVIPEDVTTIGKQAFYKSYISSIVIPEGVTKIEEKAFYEAELETVTLPSTLTSIADNAFGDCIYLTTVNITAEQAPEITATTFGITEAELYYPNGSDYSAWELYFAKTVAVLQNPCGENLSWKVIGNTLYITGTGAMYDYVDDYPEWYYEYADDITDVEIGEGVTSIGEWAFFEMYNVSNIVLPTTLETIGEGAFADIASTYTVTARSNALNNDFWGEDATLVIDDHLGRNLMNNTNTFKSVVYNRTFGAGKVGTVVLPFELSDESKRSLKFYTVGEKVGNYLIFDIVDEDDLVAGVPYIWENNNATNVNSLTSVENATVSAELAATADKEWSMVGTFSATKITDKEELQTSYFLSAGKVMNATTSLSLSPYRAYFKGPRYNDLFGEPDAAFGRKMFGVVLRGEDGDGTTVIENVTIDENGELNFDNATYDLSGRRVEDNTKGIVIKNGKKTLVK